MERLKEKIKTLPPDEYVSAIQYYEEYFIEAGPENEQKVIKELGSPEKVAALLKANHAVEDMEKSDGSAKKSLKTIFVVLIALFAAPIAIPIAIAAFAVIFSLVITLFAVFFSLFAAGAGLAIGGFLALIAAVFVIIQSPATFIFFIGFGFTSIAVGVALFLITIYLSKICFAWIANMVSKLVVRRESK
jgi:uncharacterized membrane protein